MPSRSISTLARDATLRTLSATSFDVVIIGGGITGAGLAREASLRGLRVALLDAADFAAGTSSRSSKLIHGGLRYLEQGEIELVRKTASERKEIHRLAPHLTEPRWMVIPLRSRMMLYSLRLAVATYERLGGVAAHDTQQTWTGQTLADHEPALNRKTFPFALAYREYLTDDARLVLANLRSAVELGACVLNHAAVTAFVRENNKAVGVEVRCAQTNATFVVRATTIVNAAGPWVEALQRLENPAVRPLLHLSKGVHITLSAARLPIRNLLVLTTADKRRIFALRRDEVVYIGTTDTTYERGAEWWPTVQARDIDYLLQPLAPHLAIAPCTVNDIVSTWAGLRPLIADAQTKNPSELSRRDEILVGPLGVISVAGGKLTGFRGIARRVIDVLEPLLQRKLASVDPNTEPPLPGGDFPHTHELSDFAAVLARTHAIDQHVGDRLARLYGTEASAVLAGGAALLHPHVRAVVGEVRWAIEHEGALTLEDVFYRRLRLPFFDLHAHHALRPLAEQMAALLGWDRATCLAQIDAVSAQLATDHLTTLRTTFSSPSMSPLPM